MKKCFSVMVGLCLGTVELFGMQLNPRNTHTRVYSDIYTQSSGTQFTRERAASEIPLDELYENAQNNNKILQQQKKKIIDDEDEHKTHINNLQNKILKNEKVPFKLNNTGNGSRYTARYTYRSNRSNETTGKITITEKYGTVKITGWVYNDYLDLNKKVEITVANEDQPYTFEIINNTPDTESLILLPASFIAQINEVVPCDKFVCLKFQGGNEGFVVNSEGFYIGDINNDQATGTGVMISKTGKILHGIFDHGVFMEENDHIHKKFLEILHTYKEVADGKDLDSI